VLVQALFADVCKRLSLEKLMELAERDDVIGEQAREELESRTPPGPPRP
jgi:hypothetical protein